MYYFINDVENVVKCALDTVYYMSVVIASFLFQMLLLFGCITLLNSQRITEHS